MFVCHECGVVCGVCVVCVSGASCLEIFLEQVARKGDTQECRSGARREQNPGISPGASLPVPVSRASSQVSAWLDFTARLLNFLLGPSVHFLMRSSYYKSY